MTIIIDTREPKEYKDLLREQGIPVEEKDIGFCDYIVVHGNHVVGVERKTAEDFVNSIIDGRVFNQAYMLSTLFPVSYIIVEGSIAEALHRRRFQRKAYVGALVSLALKRSPHGQRGHINIVNLETEVDTVWFISLLHKKLVEEDLDRLPVLRIDGKKNIDKQGVLIAMLQAIPGIGLEKARRLGERFKSIRNLVNATLNEIASVEGIGLETAKKIKEYLG